MPPLPLSSAAAAPIAEVILSRAQRAHIRLCWDVRLTRNARSAAGGQITIHVFGVPEPLAEVIGLKQA